jgi:hypothetical protein
MMTDTKQVRMLKRRISALEAALATAREEALKEAAIELLNSGFGKAPSDCVNALRAQLATEAEAKDTSGPAWNLADMIHFEDDND